MRRWRILCYHGFGTEHVKAFEQQLRGFQLMDMLFCSFSDGISGQRNGRLATVSFDDGDCRVGQNAQPVLDAMGIKAIHYISSDYILQGKCYKDQQPETAATWDDLGKWLEAGHEIGSHTHTHARMASCSSQQQQDELQQSREAFKKYLGIEVVHFAYPWGAHSPQTYHCIKNAGAWKSAATIDRGWNRATTDPLLLHRDLVDPQMPMRKVKFLFAVAACPPLYWLQRRMRVRKANDYPAE